MQERDEPCWLERSGGRGSLLLAMRAPGLPPELQGH